MGMKIDNNCESKPMSKEEIVDTLKTMVFGAQAFERFNAKEREALDKAWNLIDQYEARLKADIVAMLTEILTDFEEELNCGAYCDNCQKSCEDIPAGWFKDFIQQKINKLKETK